MPDTIKCLWYNYPVQQFRFHQISEGGWPYIGQPSKNSPVGIHTGVRKWSRRDEMFHYFFSRNRCKNVTKTWDESNGSRVGKLGLVTIPRYRLYESIFPLLDHKLDEIWVANRISRVISVSWMTEVFGNDGRESQKMYLHTFATAMLKKNIEFLPKIMTSKNSSSSTKGHRGIY